MGVIWLAIQAIGKLVAWIIDRLEERRIINQYQNEVALEEANDVLRAHEIDRSVDDADLAALREWMHRYERERADTR